MDAKDNWVTQRVDKEKGILCPSVQEKLQLIF